MGDLIVRTTTWQTFSNREALQVSMALLDPWWEPQMERTLACGPFHELGDRVLELEDDLRRWMRRVGYQLPLI